MPGNGIDLVKFLMALFVVAVHTHPFEPIQPLSSFVFKQAVPFFFMSTGYFLFRGENSADDVFRLVKYLKKIAKKYFFWSAIYLPLALYFYHVKNYSFLNAFCDYIKNLIFVGSHYNSWHLWYLLSVVYSMSVIILLKKMKLRKNVIYFLYVMAFVVCYGIDLLVSLDDDFFGFKSYIENSILNGRIFTGLVFIPLGAFIGRYNFRCNAILFLVFMLFGIFLGSHCENPFAEGGCLVVSSFSLFHLVKNINVPSKPVFKVLRESSSLIYFIHMYVWVVYYALLYQKIHFGLDSFVATSLVSVLISFLYLYIKSRRTPLKVYVEK